AGFSTADFSASDSFGYGLYQATLSVPSNDQQPGVAVLLWPASNQWPGPEIDLAEQLNGQAYATVHWAGMNGGDQYQSYVLPNVDLTSKTTIAVDWEPNSLTYFVNGQQVVQYSSGGPVPIPADAAHGGQNEAFGAQVGTTPGNQVTLYDMSYSTPNSTPSVGSASLITSQTTAGSSTAQFASTGDPGNNSGQTLYASPGTDVLLGGQGVDTFIVDATSTDGWAEIDNMHSGDVLNIIGFQPGRSTITWTTATDPNGQTGATADISLNGDGQTNAAVTFAGVSVTEAQGYASGNWHTASGTPLLAIWKV
ncbi:MAG TPA: family 16 glycosylhydrolase, partial [Rhodanobacter sp.]|nr:family 16 glycosylhydrolase [Rhodanobacter sp.]